MDVTLYNIHGFCHGTMGKPITWQNPYIMSFAMVYGFCHRSMAKPMGYPIPAWTRGVLILNQSNLSKTTPFISKNTEFHENGQFLLKTTSFL